MRDEPTRAERFTMLEPKGPNTVLPGSETWPVVDVAVDERFTMLEPRDSDHPPLAAVSAVPTEAQAALDKFVTTLGTLDPSARAAAINYIVTELTKRAAG